jgi:cell division protein ZapE
MNILSSYQQLIDNGQINTDPAQRDILQKLYKLQQDIETHILYNGKTLLKKAFSAKKSNIKGLYIHGDVGRGKSMLMDLFFQHAPNIKKRRVHFHAFMQEVHSTLHQWRKENKHKSDPLVPLARKIADETQLLCFDEFQVSDIVDAMLLGRLFTHLFKNGVIVVATSNRIPDDLYKDGLQRSGFLPFIELLKKHVEVVKLEAEKDYRLSHFKSLSTVYYCPIDKKAAEFLQQTFREITNNATPRPRIIKIASRDLTIEKTHGDVAWVSFSELCETALGAADYIELAREFSTIILSDIPKLTHEYRNEAKRFVNLIDELYEHKVKLICTAAAAPDQLYKSGDGSFEFERTASRLIEMQSDKYLQEEHVG